MGGQADFTTEFVEPQFYLGGLAPTRLSSDLLIVDDDTGPQYLSEATVYISAGEGVEVRGRECGGVKKSGGKGEWV